MARSIRALAMDAGVVILYYPCGVQFCRHLRRLGAGHLAAYGAEKTFDLPLVLGVMGRSIIHSQMDRRTDTPKFTASKLAAMVAHESLWDAMHEDSRLEDFHYLSDRLARIQPTGDDHAGMVVQDGNQVPVKAIVFA